MTSCRAARIEGHGVKEGGVCVEQEAVAVSIAVAILEAASDGCDLLVTGDTAEANLALTPVGRHALAVLTSRRTNG